MSKRSAASGSACCPEVGAGEAAAGSASPAAAAAGARAVPFPGLAFGLAGLVLGASVVTGSLWHELPARFAGGGSFGWPAPPARRGGADAPRRVLPRPPLTAPPPALGRA